MKTFPHCLESAKHQSSECKQIIVVDRFSQDGVASFAKANGATVIQSNVNRSGARNIGLESASSKGVLFVDADMILPITLVEECERGLDTREALIVPEESIGVGFWAECKAAERKLYIGDDTMEAARCFGRSSLLQLGGYDPQLEAGEDWDLHSRVVAHHLRVGRVRAIIIHDEGQLSLSSITRKKYLYGKSFAKYMRRNMKMGTRQVNPLRRIIVPSLKVLPSSPKLAAGVTIMKSLEFASAGFGHLVGNL